MLFDKILQFIESSYSGIVYNVYVYGSHTYGTQNDKSDVDVIALILEDKYYHLSEEDRTISFKINNIDVNCRYVHIDMFIDVLYDYTDPVFIEAYYSPIKLKEEIELDFSITEDDYPKLRRLISGYSSNSFCKAFKKIKQGDVYIGQKSLFHSIRLGMLFLEFVKNKDNKEYKNFKIGMFTELWDKILKTDLDELKQKYQPVRNNVMSEFRLVVNKE